MRPCHATSERLRSLPVWRALSTGLQHVLHMQELYALAERKHAKLPGPGDYEASPSTSASKSRSVVRYTAHRPTVTHMLYATGYAVQQCPKV